MTVRNILYLIETSGPGGAEKMLISLAAHLDRQQYRPIVGLLKNGWLSEQLESAGIETVIFQQKRSYDISCVKDIARLARNRRVSLIHAHEFMMNVYGTLAGVIAGVPVVTTVHGKNYFWDTLPRRLAYRFVARASSMVAVSQDLRNFIAQKTGASRERISAIHNGIDTALYKETGQLSDMREELGIMHGWPVVGMVGNLYPVKGYPYFLHAAALVSRVFPETVFLVAGRGKLLSQLQEQAADLGIEKQVKFLGLRDDVPKLLQLMDVFVLSSLHESFSLVTVEAMAAAKPVVVTKSGGPEEIVEDGVNGFLVPPADPDALADKIIYLLKNRDLAHAFGKAGQQRAQELFSLERMMGNYQILYEKKITMNHKGRLN